MRPFAARRGWSRMMRYRRQRKNIGKTSRLERNDDVESQCLSVVSFNVNGVTLSKLDELAEWFKKESVDLGSVSEVKKRAGTQQEDLDVEGFKRFEGLREEDQGGVMVYVADEWAPITKNWNGLAGPDQKWMNSERLWIRVEGSQRIALCGIYLRCSNGFHTVAHEKNSEMLHVLRWEADYLRQEGYKVVMTGDFNSHGGDTVNFGFEGNPHRLNSNGDLFNDFLNDQPMSVLNNRSWMSTAGELVQAKGCYTFQRVREEGCQNSVIDYAVVDDALQGNVKEFEVCEDSFVDSDHNPLLFRFEDLRREESEATKTLVKRVNWEKFRVEVEDRANSIEEFSDLSIESKSRVIERYILGAMSRVTTYKDDKWQKRCVARDSRLDDLVEKRRRLARLLRRHDGRRLSKLDFIKVFKEYRAVKDAICVRQSRLETEKRFRDSVRAKGVGARNFWSYLKQEQ